MDCPGLRKAIEDAICCDVSNQFKKLCSLKNLSILQTTTKDSVLNFISCGIGQGLNEKAQLFHRLLLVLADPKSLFQDSNPERYPGV